MNDKTLELLKKITVDNSKRQIRSLDLLKPVKDHTEGWFMCLPSCFNESLDIKQTERKIRDKKVLCWTQGALFSFKAGDIIYDTPKAYEQWDKALEHINICVSVKQAIDVSLDEGSNSRFSGSVTFAILKPNEQRTKLIEQEQQTMTQDDFVEFLIAGEGMEGLV